MQTRQRCQPRAHLHVRKSILCCLTLFAALMLVGCNPFASDEETELPLDFATLMPVEWTPLETWYPVSIDGDDDLEYLLFYLYDNGQVGAVIYDAQQDSRFVPLPINLAQPDATMEPLPIPNQPSPFYIPYRILPNYWEGTGQGFIAEPGQSGAIVVKEVYDQAAVNTSAGGASSAGDSAPRNELIIRGGNTYLTSVWWRNLQHGYGSAQVGSVEPLRGVDWGSWEENPTTISTMAARNPLTDGNARSFLCRRTDYTRWLTSTQASLATEYRSGVEYIGVDGGIDFCDGQLPSHPFYPEGVSIAYLLQENSAARSELVAPGFTTQQIDSEIDMQRLAQEIITDVQGHATVLQPSVTITEGGQWQNGSRPQTTVCIELLALATGARRGLLFILRHEPQNQAEKNSDIWLVGGVEPAFDSLTNSTGAASGQTCSDFIDKEPAAATTP